MSEAELFDYLQERFGIGEWDEATSAIPWWKFRGREIGKLKSMLKKRKALAMHVVVAAEFAIEHRRPIQAYYQLFALIPEAMVAKSRHERAQRKRDLARDIDGAVQEAIGAGETAWAARLMRTQVSEASTVLREWRER